MNIDEVIRAHVAWKSKLAAYLAKPDGSINVTDTISDKKCELGRWIYGEGSQFASLPEFAQLKKDHAQFHIAAAGIVRRADHGEPVTRDIDLGADSEFVTASRAVSYILFRIKPKIESK
ncbi:MAG: CZB domain-containing protein [Acidobacteriaceae bacterium]